MNLIAPVLRAGIRTMDAILCRVYGVWEFSHNPDCILRISVGRSPSDITLSDGTRLHSGDPVGLVHFWNERLQPIPAGGPTLAWARWMRRATRHSLRLLASYATSEPRLREVAAFGGVTSVFTSQTLGRPEELLQKWGVDWAAIAPPAAPLERFRFFLDRMYAWWLMWAYNPRTLQTKTFARVGRCQFWFSRRLLLAMYGAPQTDAETPDGRG
jgi:hypothetical protein